MIALQLVVGRMIGWDHRRHREVNVAVVGDEIIVRELCAHDDEHEYRRRHANGQTHRVYRREQPIG
jgi:hypothetical protein